MEKKAYKPVPDVECLKYHGTPEKPDIKIFVSHRIDLDSETIDNPLYIPVRCGAVYDERENVTMLGDDTGDNISEKRMSFCEYTVMYWAWKNVKADYYGLCHYRRYLSFSTSPKEEWNEQRFYYEGILNKATAKEHGLLNTENLISEFKKNDITTSITYETTNVPIIPKCTTVRELFCNHPELLTSNEALDATLDIVKKKFPQYFSSLQAELNSHLHRGFNCFVMKKDLFDQMCEYIFGILFELDRLQESGEIEQSNPREMGYIGEILYGSFIRWAYGKKENKIKEQHIVLFGDTTCTSTTATVWNCIYTQIKKFLRKILPAYRCSLRIEERILTQQQTIYQQQRQLDMLNAQMQKLETEIQHMNQREMSLFWTQKHDFKYSSDDEKLALWKNYPKANGDLRIIQNANAALLHRLRVIADSIGITFWLHGGSLIGGLRHEGYVPWDDDIDIAMMRTDFIKLKVYLDAVNPDEKVYDIIEYYYIGIGARSYRFRRVDVDAECFVDIFVYDHYDKKCDDILEDWKNLTQKKQHLIRKSRELCKELKSYPAEPLLKGYPQLKAELDKLFERYIKRTTGTEESKYLLWGMDNNYDAPGAFAWSHGRIFEYTDIFPLKKCLYEKEIFWIPNNYEKYAFAEYGIRYVEMPQNLGDSIHWKGFFSGTGQLEAAKELIELENRGDYL